MKRPFVTAPMTRKELDGDVLLSAEDYRDMARWLAERLNWTLNECIVCPHNPIEEPRVCGDEMNCPFMVATNEAGDWLEGAE